MNLRIVLVLLSLASVASATGHGDPARAAVGGKKFHPDRVLHDQASDGSLWARGAGYKARFDGRGASCVPFLGADAPASRPITFHLSKVTWGGTSVPFEPVGRVDRTGDRITIDHGAVLEVYDLMLDGIEQSFVLAEKRSGALQVAIDVETDLAAGVDEGGLTFACEDGGVRYGRASLKDAQGRLTDVASRYEAGRILIDVGADVLADARYPVTIDPLVSVFPIEYGGLDSFEADAAYDATLDAYLVTYEVAWTSTDHDVGFHLLSGDGSILTTGTIDATSEDWRKISVASLNAADQFLVVGTRDGHAVVGRTVTGIGAALGTTIVIGMDAGAAGDSYQGVVGGDPWPITPSHYCVAFLSAIGPGQDVAYQLVDPDGSLLFPLDQPPILCSRSVPTMNRPSISKSDNGDRWTVVWEDSVPNPNDERSILGAQVAWDGGLITPEFEISGPFPNQKPCVASVLADGRYLVAYERTIGNAHDVMARAFDGANPLGLEVKVSDMMQPVYQDENRIEPRLESDGLQFMLAFSQSYGGSATDYDPFVLPLALSGTTIVNSEPAFWLAYSAEVERHPALTSNRSGDGIRRRYLAVWDTDSLTNQHDVIGAFLDGPGGGTISNICGSGLQPGWGCPCTNTSAPGHGCANSFFPSGALLLGSGDASVMLDSLVLTATDIPNTTGIFLQGTTSTMFMFGDGARCAGGVLRRLKARQASGNTNVYPIAGDTSISVRGLVPATGGSRVYQLYYRNPANFCTPATFNISSGVLVNWTN